MQGLCRLICPLPFSPCSIPAPKGLGRPCVELASVTAVFNTHNLHGSVQAPLDHSYIISLTDLVK